MSDFTVIASKIANGSSNIIIDEIYVEVALFLSNEGEVHKCITFNAITYFHGNQDIFNDVEI